MSMESREVHRQPAKRRRHRGKRNLLPKDNSRASQVLVAAQWPQFEVHALQAREVVLERHAGTQSAYARKFPGACNSIALRADTAYGIENFSSPLIDFRDASSRACRSIMRHWFGWRTFRSLQIPQPLWSELRIDSPWHPSRSGQRPSMPLFCSEYPSLHLPFPWLRCAKSKT